MIAQGEAEFLLPEIVEQGKPRLAPEIQLFRLLRVVRIVSAGAPELSRSVSASMYLR
jgi:hypothetical protein